MIGTNNVFSVTDLRKNFTEVEEIAVGRGEPVLLTKNGRSSMVVMDSKMFDAVSQQLLERDLDIAEAILDNTRQWHSHAQVFSNITEKIQNAV